MIGTTTTTQISTPKTYYGISTQLLTLSIHDDLTFEGTEIAIHPELFLSSNTTTTDTASNTNSSSPDTSSLLLKVNDLILIRVWDDKNKEQSNNTKNNYNNILHENELSLTNNNNNEIDPLFQTHNLKTNILMRITQKSISSFKTTSSIAKQCRTQISLLRTLADLYNISSFSQITITKILNKQYENSLYTTATADFVTIIFKDQFISRGDMFHFQNLLLGKLIYEGKRLNSHDGIRAYAKSIQHDKDSTNSGFVTPDTKIIFRSRSSRIIWLIQLSLEMWDYVDPYNDKNNSNLDTSHCSNSSCEIYFDTLIHFLYKLFGKWKEMDVTHSLTVVFFSRTYWRMNNNSSPLLGCPNTSMDSNSSGFNKSPKHSSFNSDAQSTATYVDIDGRLYEDHYKVIIENETRTDWETLVHTIKKEFVKYPTEVQWDYNESASPHRIPSTASQGNILEAINVTLNLLQLHYMDRDLHRTGNSIVVCSAGCGVFEVDKNLASMTKQRMMDNGIGSDMLSLSLPPLHVAPFFLYKEVSEALQEESHGYDDWKTYFEIPHWMHLSFIHYDQDDVTSELHSQKQTYNENHINQDHLSNEGEKNKDIEIGSNGFLIRRFNQEATADITKKDKTVSNNTNENATMDGSNHSNANNNPNNNPKYRSSMQQRDLISGRDFNDILQACRPMYRGESNIALPSALKASFILGRFQCDSKDDGPITNASLQIEKEDNWSPFSLGTPLVTNTRSISLEQQQVAKEDTLQLQEWGTVNFNEFCSLQLQQQQQQQLSLIANNNLTMVSHESPPWESASVMSCDTASPSSSFNSNFSYLLNRRCNTGSGNITIDEMNELSGNLQRSQCLGSTDTTKLSPLFGGLQIQKPSSYDFLSMESYFPTEMVAKHQDQKIKKITPKKEKIKRNQSEVLFKNYDTHNEDLLGHHSMHIPLSSSFGQFAPPVRIQPRSKSGGDENEMIESTNHDTTTANTATPDIKENLKLLMNAYDNQIFASSLSQKSSKQQLQQHFNPNTSNHSIQSILVPSILEKPPLDNSTHLHHSGVDSNVRGVTATTGARSKRNAKPSAGEGIGAALTNYNKYVNEARLRHQQQEASYMTYPPVLPNANTLEVQKARRKILESVNNKPSSSTQSVMMTRGSPDKHAALSITPLGRLPEHRSTSQGNQQVVSGPTVNQQPDNVYSSGILNQYPYNVFFAPPAASAGNNPNSLMNRNNQPITVSHGLAGASANKIERTKLITPTSTAIDKKLEAALPIPAHRRKSTNTSVVSFTDSKKPETKSNVDKQQQSQFKVAHQRVLKHISKKHEHHHSGDQTRKKNRHHKHKTRHTSRSTSNKSSDIPITSTNAITTTQRKPWVLNPFRQRDESEILQRRTANRRRWSHVFPLGEEEFKRHSGPLWNSLCQPAVLPLTIDVFPSPKELNNTNKFQFNPYQITLDAMDGTYYKNNTDLLEEMITQRLIQDFQIVPPSVVQSAKRAEVEDLRKARQSVKANRSRRYRKDDVAVDGERRRGSIVAGSHPIEGERRRSIVVSDPMEIDRRRGSIISSVDSGSSAGNMIDALRPRRRGSSNNIKVDNANPPLSRGTTENKEVTASKVFGLSCGPPTGFSRYVQNIATGDYDDPYSSSGSTVQCTLSMGHKIHIISYNPVTNDIEVVQHVAVFAQNDLKNTLTYNYMLWVPSIQKYKRVVQHFTKYGNSRFQWSYLDNLICGDPQKTLTEGTRFRRNSFCIIPERKNFMDESKEQEYVQRFQRLLEYLNKLKQQNNNDTSSNDKINIRIVTSKDGTNESNDTASEQQDNKKGRKQPRRVDDDVKHFIVSLRRKGGRDDETKFEWMELVIDGTFYTNRSYRITVQWLVASANKVDTQTQLLLRRCTQYGLHLVSISQSSISSNPFLNPFIAPPCIPVRDKEKAMKAEEALTNKFHFIYEGNRYTYPQFLDGIEQFNFQFDDKTRMSKVLKEVVPSNQYIHPAGALFVRVLKDCHGWAMFIIMKNRNLANLDVQELKRSFIKEFCLFIHARGD